MDDPDLLDPQKAIDRQIGALIAEKRNSDSHKATAEAAGMGIDKLKRIERGDEHPSEADLRVLACALGTSPETFLPPGITLEGYE